MKFPKIPSASASLTSLVVIMFLLGMNLNRIGATQEVIEDRSGSFREPATLRSHPLPTILEPVFAGTGIKYFEVKEYEAFFLKRVLRIRNGSKPGTTSELKKYSYKNFKDLPFQNDEQRRCFAIIASGGSFCPPESFVDDLVSRFSAKDDLLTRSREIAVTYGMRISRDFVEKALAKQDDGNSAFEGRILRATAQKDLRYEDSILNVAAESKSKIGIFFIAGYNHDRGVSADVMDAAAEHLKSLGFVSERLTVKPAGSSEDNAILIREHLESRHPQLSQIVVVALSKGASDLSRFVVNELPRASVSLQRKIRVLVSLSGVVRDAFVPRWMSYQKGPTTHLLRAYMRQFLPKNHRDYDGLESMAKDYWTQNTRFNANTSLPLSKILWISFPMIPESERGMPERKQALVFGTRLVKKSNDSFGPHDGLVETAASILPPNSGLSQWVIRARGDHGLIDGNYLNKEPVSYAFQKTQDNILAGVELIDAFVRALPASAILQE